MQTSGLKGAPHMLRARRRRHPTCCAVLVAATFATAARGFITSPLSSAFFASPQQSSAAAAGLQRSNAADGVLRQSPHRVYGVNEGRRMQTGRRRCVSNQQAADDVEAVVAAAAAVPELESHVESGLYASIKEQWRIHRKQKDLQEIIGRSVSVAEWAGAAGYRDSATMLAAINAGSRALNQLVRHHRPLVCAMARRYRRVTRFLTYDDLVQEGSVGLLSAVDHYDPTRGARFGTYAAWRVRGYMLRAIANKDTLIRLPVHVQDLGDRIRQAARRLGATGGPPPSDDELAGAVGVSLEAFRRHQALVESARAAAGGLDTEAGAGAGDAAAAAAWRAGGGAFGGISGAGAGSEGGWSRLAREDLIKVLETYLAPRETEALRLRYGLGGDASGPLTFVEIGRAMELSGEGIRRIIFRALEKLKESEAAQALGEFLVEMG